MTSLDRANRYAALLISLLILLPFAGCASLPNIRELTSAHDLAAVPPEVRDGAGPLSMKESHAIISRLRREAGPTDVLRRHVILEEALSGQPLIAGNRVQLLRDGPETFAAMGAAIRKATDHINLETFILRDDEVGRPLSDLLIRKRREGVQVNIIYDSFGAIRTPDAFFDRMRENGLNVMEFNPIPGGAGMEGWGINNRDHRKILVVDGRIAFTGGINFYRVYARSSSELPKRHEEQLEHYWRDIHIQVEGPAVEAFQRFFMEMWRLQKGRVPSGANYFPPLEEVGDSLMRVIGSTPDQPIPSIYAAYISAIIHAEKSIYLTHAYLVLDQGMLEALSDAAQQGVEVKIIVPSYSDFWLPFYAARHNYTELLRSGVRIFQRRGALLHSKTAVVDGVWSTVGSSNLDLRSFLHDAEINAVILGIEFGQKMERLFAEDLAASTEVLLDEWKRRPWFDRVKEQVARLFRYWL
jgi:cardiolipin synthase